MAQQIDRINILNTIGEKLQNAIQWKESSNRSMESVQRFHQYMIKAETLVELLEVQDCGSIGGFDIGQEDFYAKTLFGRWLWLYEKYDNDVHEEFFNSKNTRARYGYNRMEKELGSFVL